MAHVVSQVARAFACVLVDGDGLGEVAGEVGVDAAEEREVVGEELEREHGDESLSERGLHSHVQIVYVLQKKNLAHKLSLVSRVSARAPLSRLKMIVSKVL